MVKRNLTLAEFCKLSGEEQMYQYKDLSEREKFGARQMDVSTTGPYVPCNDCSHNRGNGTCDAFPEGITSEGIDKVTADFACICNADTGFEKMPYVKASKRIQSKFWHREAICAGRDIPCSSCRHYRQNGTCDAYLSGITSAAIDRVIKNIDCDCNDGIKFEGDE